MRRNCVKFHHCWIGLTNFREGGPFYNTSAKNFMFLYCSELEGDIFTTKITKVASNYQRFRRRNQLAIMECCYLNKHHFFQSSFSSCFCRLYCWLNYSASLWINLFGSLSAYTLKFFSLAYWNLHTNIGIVYSKEIATSNVTTTTATINNNTVTASSGLEAIIQNVHQGQ